jgi:hypothetical protein
VCLSKFKVPNATLRLTSTEGDRDIAKGFGVSA